MKFHKRAFSAIVSVGMAGVLLCSGTASAVANIQTLDYTRTGSYVIDCGLLNDIEIARDSSWSDALYYAYQFAEYKHQTEPDKYPTADAYRTEAINYFKNNWDIFAGEEFYWYAMYAYEDFEDREWYYSGYQTALNDDYFLLYASHEMGVEDPSFLSHTHGYDIIANYCSGDRIPTTYAWAYTSYETFTNGYQPILRIGDEEVWLEKLFYDGEEKLTPLENGYSFHRDGLADLKVELEKLNNTTVRATYTLKNLTGAAAPYGLAVISDTEFGYNDEAAIRKTDRGFVVTQDNPLDMTEEWEYPDTPEWMKKFYDYDLSKTFGAQFSINLDPVPTSTYVGDYEVAEYYKWENSEEDSYDVFDEEDTGLAFSWQGNIEAEEEKVFTATYNMALAEFINNNFYYLADSYAEPTVVPSIKNGILYFPATNDASGVGKHREWNTSPDGTGESYASEDIIRAGETGRNFYEIEIANDVVGEPYVFDWNVYSYWLEPNDKLRERYADILSEYSNNAHIVFNLEVLTEGDIESDISDNRYTLEKIQEAAGGGVVDELIYYHDGYYDYIEDEDGYEEDIFSDTIKEDLPVTAHMQLDAEFAKNNSNFRLVRMKLDENGEFVEEYIVVPTTFDRKTGILTFEETKDFEGSLFAFVYDDVPAEPEAPDAPSTGEFIAEHTAAVAGVALGFPALMMLLYVIRRIAKR